MVKVHKAPIFLKTPTKQQNKKLLWTNRPGLSGLEGIWFFHTEYKAWARVEGVIDFLASPYDLYSPDRHERFCRSAFNVRDHIGGDTSFRVSNLIIVCEELLQYYGEHYD